MCEALGISSSSATEAYGLGELIGLVVVGLLVLGLSLSSVPKGDLAVGAPPAKNIKVVPYVRPASSFGRDF